MSRCDFGKFKYIIFIGTDKISYKEYHAKEYSSMILEKKNNIIREHFANKKVWWIIKCDGKIVTMGGAMDILNSDIAKE